MLKRLFIGVILIILSYLFVGILYESIDNSTAVKFAKSITNPESFVAYDDYVRTNSIVDGFSVPGYFWGYRKVVFHNWLWRFSNDSYLKTIVFLENGSSQVIYVKPTESVAYIKNESDFNTSASTTFSLISKGDAKTKFLSKGDRLRLSIVTGAPTEFPNDGMKVTESMLYAKDFAAKPKQIPAQVNSLQLHINGASIFPVGQITLYDYKK